MLPDLAALDTQSPSIAAGSCDRHRSFGVASLHIFLESSHHIIYYDLALCDRDLCHILKELTSIISVCPFKGMFSNNGISWLVTQMWHSNATSSSGAGGRGQGGVGAISLHAQVSGVSSDASSFVCHLDTP